MSLDGQKPLGHILAVPVGLTRGERCTVRAPWRRGAAGPTARRPGAWGPAVRMTVAMSRPSPFGHPFLLGFDEIEQALDRVSKAASDGYPSTLR